MSHLGTIFWLILAFPIDPKSIEKLIRKVIHKMIDFGSDFRSDLRRQDGPKTGSRGRQDGQDGPKRPQDGPPGAPRRPQEASKKLRAGTLVRYWPPGAFQSPPGPLQGPPGTPPRPILGPKIRPKGSQRQAKTGQDKVLSCLVLSRLNFDQLLN